MKWFHRLNRRYLLRYRLEYLFALFLVYFVRALSPSFAWEWARLAGRLAFRLGLRREAMLANLRAAFPGLDEGARERIALQAMEHFGCLAVDVLFQRRMLSRRNLYERVRIEGWGRRYLEEHGEEGLRQRARGILFVTAHMGNWELSSGFFGLLGVNIIPVYRAAANPFFDRLLRRIRLDRHGEMLERRGAVQEMLERLQRGDNIGFLFDQEALYGIYVPFFGRPTCVHKTPAVLARDFGVRIFFGVMLRRGDFFRYDARGELLDFGEWTGDRETDLHRVTAELMHRLEEEVRQNPGQFFWMHRRWKRPEPAKAANP